MIHPKRVLYSGGAAGALALAYFVGSVTLGGAFAQQAPTAPAPAAQAEQPDQPEPAGPNEQGEAAALASQAKITADQARAAALAQSPGATVRQVQLENENGTPVYGVQLTDSSGKGQDVKVDASTGQVLPPQADGPEGQDANGQNEGGAQD